MEAQYTSENSSPNTDRRLDICLVSSKAPRQQIGGGRTFYESSMDNIGSAVLCQGHDGVPVSKRCVRRAGDESVAWHGSRGHRRSNRPLSFTWRSDCPPEWL